MTGWGIVTSAPPQPMEVWVPARRRLAASVAGSLITGGATGRFAAWQVTVLAAWCGGAVTFVGLAWTMMLTADAERTRTIAMREDESQLSLDLLVLWAGLASLVGVGFILEKASSTKGGVLAAMTGLGVASIVLAWLVVHTVFTLRYADLYYSQGGGIDFNQTEDPDYRDFAYLALTIGMTYQVSDTALGTKAIRRTALKHALLSYLFGTAIIAVMINIVASIAR